MTRIGVAVLARPTFDVPYAQEMAAAAWQRLGELGHELIGSPELILDADALGAATAALSNEPLDALVLVQATFADATLAAAIADANPAPLLLWAIPEERTGGRLRLNSFCGINLAGYRLTREGRRYRFLYRHPGDASATGAIATLARGAAARQPCGFRAAVGWTGHGRGGGCRRRSTGEARRHHRRHRRRTSRRLRALRL